jgi:hypothetical protein
MRGTQAVWVGQVSPVSDKGIIFVRHPTYQYVWFCKKDMRPRNFTTPYAHLRYQDLKSNSEQTYR